MKYPKTIYVKYQSERDTTWLVASKTPNELAEQDEVIRGAQYQLVGEVSLVNTTAVNKLETLTAKRKKVR